MPIGPWEDFAACVAHFTGEGHDDESAKKICGSIEAKQRGVDDDESVQPDEDDQQRAAAPLAALGPAPARNAYLKNVDAFTRSAVFLASTTDPVPVPNPDDPDGALVDEIIESWDLERFRSNPVVLWSHKKDELPVGSAREIAVMPDGLAVRVYFARAKASPLADQTWEAVHDGVLRAVSVGYRPGSVRTITGPGGAPLRIVSNAELLEVSLVTVPADQRALVQEPAGATPSSRATPPAQPPVQDPELTPEEKAAQDRRRKRVAAAARLLARHRVGQARARIDAGDLPSGANVVHLDGSQISEWETLTTGGLRVPARLTRTGVLTYDYGGVRVRELRLPEEVFSEESLRTLRGVPVTVEHPGDKKVNSKTWRERSSGHVGDNVAHDDRFVTSDLVVQDDAAVRGILAGHLRECSAGYRCDMEHAPGVYGGEEYDVIQRNIRYNHVALLPSGRGRAGSEVGLRSDAADEVDDGRRWDWAVCLPGADEMTKIHVDGKEFVMGSSEHLAHIDAAHRSEVSDLSKKLEGEKARADGLDEKLKKSERELADARDPKALAAMVDQRSQFISRAKTFLGQDAKIDGKTDREIRVEAIVKARPEFKADGRSDAYIEAAFDQLDAASGRRADSISSVVSGLKDAQREERADQDEDDDEDEVPPWRQPLAHSKREQRI